MWWYVLFSLAVVTLTVGASTAGTTIGTVGVAAIVSCEGEATWWAWAGGESWIAAEHGNPRPVLRAAQGDHVLAYVCGYNFTTLWISVRENVLDQIVAKLISSNYDVRG